jgi:hypothetical protein
MSDNIENVLRGTEVIEQISPMNIIELKQKYEHDCEALLLRVSQDKDNILAFKGAIAACDEILKAHITSDTVELEQ